MLYTPFITTPLVQHRGVGNEGRGLGFGLRVAKIHVNGVKVRELLILTVNYLCH
jgi:hypothetical protein